MKSFKEARQDPHRPSVLDPSEYTYVGCADDHDSDSYFEMDHDKLREHGVETDEHNWRSSAGVPWYDATQDNRPNYRCHHCGKHGSNIRYFVFFLHKPTKVVITVGQICAKKLNLGSKEELDLQKRANAFRHSQERSTWAKAHEDVYNFLAEYAEAASNGGTRNEFYESLWEGLRKYGSLTPNQLRAIEHNIERARRRAEAGPVVDSNRATEAQISYINGLMEERSMTTEARHEARRRIDAGLSKKLASAYINRLKELPKIGEAA